ncbi:hypothetical protein HOC73_02560, partial [bacterium]|nr:hypothetical protein [bacterium]
QDLKEKENDVIRKLIEAAPKELHHYIKASGLIEALIKKGKIELSIILKEKNRNSVFKDHRTTKASFEKLTKAWDNNISFTFTQVPYEWIVISIKVALV